MSKLRFREEDCVVDDEEVPFAPLPLLVLEEGRVDFEGRLGLTEGVRSRRLGRTWDGSSEPDCESVCSRPAFLALR